MTRTLLIIKDFYALIGAFTVRTLLTPVSGADGVSAEPPGY